MASNLNFGVTSPPHSVPFALGRYRVDLATTRLLRDDVEMALRPQAVQALGTLLRHAGGYVDYERMIHEAWHGVWVSRHTVAVTIGEVKRALGECGAWIHYRPKLGYRLEVPRADGLIRLGWHCWCRQTREGLEKALDCYRKASEQDSSDARAFQGMAASYLLLGTYGMHPPREMYAAFQESHQKAVALAGMTPELRADRAHGLHVFERRLADAEAELLEAFGTMERRGTVYVRRIMLCATSGRLDEALSVLEQANAENEVWGPLPAAEIFIRLCRHEIREAIECGEEAVSLHPYLPLCRILYAQALLASGRTCDALKQYRIARTASPDLAWLPALEGVCLARMKQGDEANRILGELNHLRSTEYVDAYFMAILLDALGRKDEALRELDRAYSENSATLFILDVDPRMDSLRREPRFTEIRDRVFAPANARAAAAAPVIN